MVQIFDLPPGGLADGGVAQEVDAAGNPIKKDKDIKSKVTVTEVEPSSRVATPTPEEPSGSNAGGMAISMRPKLAVHLMRVEFPDDIIT